MRYIAIIALLVVVGCRKSNSNENRHSYTVTHEQNIFYYIDTVDSFFPVEQSFYVSSDGVVNKNLHFVKYGVKKTYATEIVHGMNSLDIGNYKSAIDHDSFYHYKDDTIAKMSIYISGFKLVE